MVKDSLKNVGDGELQVKKPSNLSIEYFHSYVDGSGEKKKYLPFTHISHKLQKHRP